jgi:hypothetical protein
VSPLSSASKDYGENHVVHQQWQCGDAADKCDCPHVSNVRRANQHASWTPSHPLKKYAQWLLKRAEQLGQAQRVSEDKGQSKSSSTTAEMTSTELLQKLEALVNKLNEKAKNEKQDEVINDSSHVCDRN